MSNDCSVCKLVIPQFRTHKLSKEAYRAHLLGMYVRVMRSLLFNMFIFFLGTTIGMGFILIHMKNAIKDKYDNDTIIKLEHTLQKHNILNEDVEKILLEMKDKSIKHTAGK